MLICRIIDFATKIIDYPCLRDSGAGILVDGVAIGAQSADLNARAEVECGASGERSGDLNARAMLESGASTGGRSSLGARGMVSPVLAVAVLISSDAIKSGAMQNPHAASVFPRVQA
ncbi:hypothetical protein RIF29_29127 [Crotalaria pallida]|uniref:Uncharacterized protein n=1 Tax=Crotalaria pallida TaxID=3830 RepID=A0AAN9EKQ0_CROPI